jgi:cytochrome c2
LITEIGIRFFKTDGAVRLNKKFFLHIFIILQLLILSLTFQANAQLPEGESLFKLNCSACHTIGKGKLIGPDLANVESRREIGWIKRFIKSSQTLIQGGDPTALAVYNEYDQVLMPDQVALTLEQIDKILAYIKSTGLTAQPGATVSLKLDQKPVVRENINASDGAIDNPEILDEQVLKGRELFLGVVKLKEGGPSCNSCHNVTEDEQAEGGIFAPDLTNVYSRIDEKEIMELATAPRYPSMQKAYQDKSITLEEAQLIAAFLKYAGTGSDYQQKRDQRAADLLKRFNKEGPE